MDFVSSAVLGGIFWDFVKYAVEPTTERVREAVAGKLKIDERIELAITKELNVLDISKCKSESDLVTCFDSSKTMQNILKEINKCEILIQSFGTGDAFYGDKVMGNKIINN